MLNLNFIFVGINSPPPKLIWREYTTGTSREGNLPIKLKLDGHIEAFLILHGAYSITRLRFKIFLISYLLIVINSIYANLTYF